MIKLKQVILQLSDDSFKQIEETFRKTKAENYVLLFQSYRVGEVSDQAIIEKLGVSPNSFYVLKSRLYDKIQAYLSEDVFTDRDTLTKELLQVQEICFTKPRETAIAFLQKLEKELLKYDLHNDLMVVYSALKKMHLYSERYFHYSQLFNKHAGLGLSLEKAEELLGNFNRILGQYNFSRSQSLLDTLNFLKIEIVNLYSLNPSRQIEIIRNIIELELLLFCQETSSSEYSAEELLNTTRKVFAELPSTAAQKKWEIVLDYLCFEYYFSKNEFKTAIQYFEKVNPVLPTLLLYNNIGLTSKFLISKFRFCDELDRKEDLELVIARKELLYDSGDVHAKVLMEIFTAMLYFKHKKMKEAIMCLNEILNTVSFKDYFHESIDVKLTLAYFYMSVKEYDLVENTTKSISRKIKTEHPDRYAHVLHLIRIFDIEIGPGANAKGLAKSKDLFTLFSANNVKSGEVLVHLIPELKRKYQS